MQEGRKEKDMFLFWIEQQKLQQEVSYFTYLRLNSGKAQSLLCKKVLGPNHKIIEVFQTKPQTFWEGQSQWH